MTGRQHDRCTGHAAIQFCEGDDGTGKGDCANGDTQYHFYQTGRFDVANRADAKSVRSVECSSGHHDSCQADQRVERGHKLRHGCHRDVLGHIGTEAATDDEADQDQRPAAGVRPGQYKRSDNGDCHAHHAIKVTLTAGRGMGKAAQGHDEQDA